MPPTWRADLTREIDLIEEVARIYGYEQIPEDAGVKMVVSTRSREDRVLEQVRDVLVATGFCEAMTISAVDRSLVDTFQPWSSAEPLTVSTPVLRRADCLRQTLLAQFAGRPADERKALERGDRTFRDRQRLSAPTRKTARPAADAFADHRRQFC